MNKLEELAVGFFNGFTRRTISGGAVQPKTGLIITSNCSFAENQRYIAIHLGARVSIIAILHK